MEHSELTTQEIFTMLVTCAWCKKDLGTKSTSIAENDGKTSHGMCIDCAKGPGLSSEDVNDIINHKSDSTTL